MNINIIKYSILISTIGLTPFLSFGNVHILRENERVTIQEYYMPYTIPEYTGYTQSPIQNIDISIVENILSTVENIQCQILNIPCYRNIIIAQPKTHTIQAIWYTNPAIVLYDGSLGETAWVSLFHEIAHVLTLSYPLSFRLGGKIDGCANALVSETLAQVLSITATQELLQGSLDPEIRMQVSESLNIAYGYLSLYHERYKESNNFITWNDPQTMFDETMPTFMGISYELLATCRESCFYTAKQIFSRVQTFNLNMCTQYDQHKNTPEADIFRKALILFWLFGYNK